MFFSVYFCVSKTIFPWLDVVPSLDFLCPGQDLVLQRPGEFGAHGLDRSFDAVISWMRCFFFVLTATNLFGMFFLHVYRKTVVEIVDVWCLFIVGYCWFPFFGWWKLNASMAKHGYEESVRVRSGFQHFHLEPSVGHSSYWCQQIDRSLISQVLVKTLLMWLGKKFGWMNPVYSAWLRRPLLFCLKKKRLG